MSSGDLRQLEAGLEAPFRRNARARALRSVALTAGAVTIALSAGAIVDGGGLVTDLTQRNLPPSGDHPFGTDWLGRDMFARTLKGLALSVGVGLAAASGSALVSLLLGTAAATLGKTADRAITWLIDLFLSVPHLVSLLLISFALGGGAKGIAIGIMLTHWPSLARIIRAEVMQLRNADYIRVSRRLGKSRRWIVFKHMLPHLAPQAIVGVLLLFPHAVLHEAAITFLGFGLPPDRPAIGIILSESMRYLSTGMWWLAFFPGLCLFLVVRAFDSIGDRLRSLVDPVRANRP